MVNLTQISLLYTVYNFQDKIFPPRRVPAKFHDLDNFDRYFTNCILTSEPIGETLIDEAEFPTHRKLWQSVGPKSGARYENKDAIQRRCNRVD